jgi:Ran GTPase-activating protein (RanGAP) involved in mRNA processing and transport
LGYDQFIVLAGTIRNSRRLRFLDLSSNQLRNQGCIEVANMLVSNTGLQSLNLDNNDIREAGLVALLKVLKENRSLVNLRLENNKFTFSRQLLGFLGDVFVYHNRTLRTMIMTSLSKATPILRREQDEGSEYDRDMVANFI